MMKKVNALLLGLLVAFSFSCGDDDDGGPSGPQDEDFVGVWVLADVDGFEDQETAVAGGTPSTIYATTIENSNDTNFTLAFTAQPNNVLAAGNYTLVSNVDYSDPNDDDEIEVENFNNDDEFFGSWTIGESEGEDTITFTEDGDTETYIIETLNSSTLVLVYADVETETGNNAVTTTTTEITYTFSKQQ